MEASGDGVWAYCGRVVRACVCGGEVDASEEERISGKYLQKSSFSISDCSHSRHFKYRDDNTSPNLHWPCGLFTELSFILTGNFMHSLH